MEHHISISYMIVLEFTGALDYVWIGNHITQPFIDMRTRLYIVWG
jgi:hypothetical protein